MDFCKRKHAEYYSWVEQLGQESADIEALDLKKANLVGDCLLTCRASAAAAGWLLPGPRWLPQPRVVERHTASWHLRTCLSCGAWLASLHADRS